MRFTDMSFNGPTYWRWTFGDGAVSEEQNPQHAYANAGTYEVWLYVKNNVAGSHTSRRITVR